MVSCETLNMSFSSLVARVTAASPPIFILVAAAQCLVVASGSRRGALSAERKFVGRGGYLKFALFTN